MGENLLTSKQQGVQSFELGMHIFKDVIRLNRAFTLAELSASTGISLSSTHKYCVSMIRLGLLSRDGRGRYKLGPFLYSLTNPDARLDRVQVIAGNALPELVNTIGETSFLSIWTHSGPMAIKVHEADKIFSVRVVRDRAFPITNTCAGRIFGAFLDREMVSPLVEAEFSRMKEERKLSKRAVAGLRREFEDRMTEAKRRGLSRTTGERHPGVNSVSAPIFDQDGRLLLTITAFGPQVSCSASWEGPVAKAVGAFAAQITGQTGGRPPLEVVSQREECPS